MVLANPILIQDVPRSRNEPPPLFLIHDASGLITSYYKLGPLGRKVYGIWDPKFDQDGIGGWQTVQEIADAYLRLIRRVMLRGEIVLGGKLPSAPQKVNLVRLLTWPPGNAGWSFGGIVAVQIAHMIARQGRGLRVSKIILVDSVYPRCDRPEARKGPPHARHAPMLPGISEDTRNKLLTALMRATCISDHWVPPAWSKRMDHHVGVVRATGERPRPPPVVLIRADGLVPTVEKNEMCPLDRTRFLPQLGWEDMQEGFVSKVLHTAGNHYNIFDEAHAPMITACIRKSLDMSIE